MNSENKQQRAIADYLHALLDDEPVSSKSVDEPVYEETRPSVVGLDKLIEAVPDVNGETALDQLANEIIQTEPSITRLAEPEAEIVEQAVATDAIIPDWAAEPFQCLLFRVAGLTLAVPLVKLKSVMPWTDKIVETPNRTEWYLGLVQNLGTNVKVIDTALMVLPENRRETLEQNPEQRFSHILLVNDAQWGLACESIGDVIWLRADQVKWRKNKLKRPWLAGTALEYLCAIMDTEVFAEMLDNPVS